MLTSYTKIHSLHILLCVPPTVFCQICIPDHVIKMKKKKLKKKEVNGSIMIGKEWNIYSWHLQYLYLLLVFKKLFRWRWIFSYRMQCFSKTDVYLACCREIIHLLHHLSCIYMKSKFWWWLYCQSMRIWKLLKKSTKFYDTSFLHVCHKHYHFSLYFYLYHMCHVLFSTFVLIYFIG